MSKIEQSILLITGGDSGLGKAIVLKVLQHEAAIVIIWCRKEIHLNTAAKEFWQKGFIVKTFLVDVSNEK